MNRVRFGDHDRGAAGWRPFRFDQAALATLVRLAHRIVYGRLTLVLPDESTINVDGTHEHDRRAVLRIRHARAARRLFVGGAVGFAEAYMDGDWDTPDLPGLLAFARRNHHVLDRAAGGLGIVRAANRLLHLTRRNTRAGSRRNIASHYDLSNTFFGYWLDRGMTYSSGVFENGRDTLEQSQDTKYERISDALGLTNEHHVLEIGCGWGGFAEYAARTRGCRVTGITVSREQAAYARTRIAAAGLSDRVEIRLQDYRDVEGRFDRIASIEMFEAVGETYWHGFFGTVRERLRAGGVAAMQIITIADDRFESYRRSADFIQRFIFPGGMLPSPTVLRSVIAGSGLHLAGEEGFAPSYARTLELWRDRFHNAWPSIETLGFDRRFRRMWDYYLAYCEAGFRLGALDVLHLRMVRPAGCGTP